MRQIKAKQVKHLIIDACKAKGVEFTYKGYRAAKEAYNQIPRTRRHLVA